MEFKSAKCPSCGGELQLPEDKDQVKCMYCGNDIVVKKALAKESEDKIPNLLNLAKRSLQGHNYEEAFTYYTKVLELDAKNYEAWIGKGVTSIKKLNKNNIQYDEAVKIDVQTEIKKAESCIDNAQKIKSDNENTENARVEIRNSAIQLLLKLADVKYEKARSKYQEDAGDIFEKVKKAEPNMKEVLDDWKQATKLDPTDIEIMKKIVNTDTVFMDLRAAIGTRYSIVGKNTAEFKKDLENKIKEKEPGFKKQGACFVATVAYGTPLADEIYILKYWRDSYLINNVYGKLFIKIYYHYGAITAQLISKSQISKAVTRKLLDEIVKYISKKIKG